jgi:hypothetical protein
MKQVRKEEKGCSRRDWIPLRSRSKIWNKKQAKRISTSPVVVGVTNTTGR